MADVTLAECEGNVWLVEGEQHLDALLLGSFPPDLRIEFVACASQDELRGLWAELSGNAGPGCDPWAIHPGLVERIRSIMGQDADGDTRRAVVFGAWSALLDADAHAAIGDAAQRLAAEPALTLLLRSHEAAFVPGMADLQRLRVQLLAAALTRLGCDPARLREETVPPPDAGEPQPDRIELVTVLPVDAPTL